MQSFFYSQYVCSILNTPPYDIYLVTHTLALTTFEKEGYVRHKNNLRQYIPCDAYLSTDCIKRGEYMSVKNDLRQHIFYRHISPSPKMHQCSVYKEHPFEKRTQHISNNKLHFLFPISIFVRHFQTMCQESFISYLH